MEGFQPLFVYLSAHPWISHVILLCTDVTVTDIINGFRTGKRTSMGLLQDGYNSAVRYFMNNFQDGFRQVRSFLSSRHHSIYRTTLLERSSIVVKTFDVGRLVYIPEFFYKAQP